MDDHATLGNIQEELDACLGYFGHRDGAKPKNISNLIDSERFSAVKRPLMESCSG
jgi:hypothetical protein